MWKRFYQHQAWSKQHYHVPLKDGWRCSRCPHIQARLTDLQDPCGRQLIDFSIFQVLRDFPSFLCSPFAAAALWGLLYTWAQPQSGAPLPWCPLALLLRGSLWFYCLTPERSFFALGAVGIWDRWSSSVGAALCTVRGSVARAACTHWVPGAPRRPVPDYHTHLQTILNAPWGQTCPWLRTCARGRSVRLLRFKNLVEMVTYSWFLNSLLESFSFPFPLHFRVQ